MKKYVIFFVLITITLNLIAIIPNYLIKLDRKALRNYEADNSHSKMNSQLFNINQYYTTESFILAGANEYQVNNLPNNIYCVLDNIDQKANYYLISVSTHNLEKISSNVGNIISQLDNTILIKSALNEIDFRKHISLPFVKLDFIPLENTKQSIDSLLSEKINQNIQLQNLRTDFGNILTSINADSVQWFMQQLQNMETRNALAANRRQVALWIKNQFVRFGYSNAYLDSFLVYGYRQYNVVASQIGTINPDQVIVIGGHHDSVVNDGNDPMVVAPGADDNASGTTACLEIARVMKANNYQPECTITFVTFACEEYGLWGSKDFAQKALQNGMHIKLMINHDMIANCTQPQEDWLVRMMPYEGFENYTALAMNITSQQTDLMPYAGNLNSAGSDSHSFWQRGFPCIYFFEHQFSPYYHSINDIVTNTNPLYAKEVIKASAAVTITFDQMPSTVKDVSIIDGGTGNTLIVRWRHVSDSDVVGYRVYYTSDFQGNLPYISVTDTTCVITGLIEGTNYYVSVNALDVNGNESMSKFYSATPYLIPLTPSGFTDNPLMYQVQLVWQSNQEADLAGYEIFKSNDPNGTFNLVATISQSVTSWTDTNVIDGMYYYYKLRAFDQDNHFSPFTHYLRTRSVTLNQGILIIDETRNNTGNTVFAPNDAVCDAFYNNAMQGFTYSQYDTETDGVLKLADIGIYSSILWHGNDMGDLDYCYIVRDEIRKYLDYGGKILITSYKPTLAFDLNDAYPRTFSSESFLYQTFGIANTWFTNSARFRYAVPVALSMPSLQVDSLKTISSLNGHIYMIEAIGAAPDASDIYYYDSDYDNSTPQGSMNDLPIGVFKDHNPGKSIVLSFPLYNMKAEQVRNLLTFVFGQLFGETPIIDESEQIPLAHLHLGYPYPNPFNNTVSCTVSIKDLSTPVIGEVYNIKGQLVRTLFKSYPDKSSFQITWNGMDDLQHMVSPGIYFIKLSQAGKTKIRKALFLK